jgi:hypothetical protein
LQKIGAESAKKLCRWFDTLNLTHVFLILFFIGVLARIVTAVVMRVPVVIFFAEMEQIARSLAEHGTFADPYRVHTGPTAHHAPVYPVLLSLIFRTFGYGKSAALAMMFMNFCFGSLQYALLPLVTDAARIHRIVGVTAGTIGALLPYRIFREFRWEATLSALVIVALTLITSKWWQARSPSRLHTFAVGLAWGAGMLCSANLLLVFLITLFFVAISARRKKQAGWQLTIALAALGMIVAVTPWNVRNYRALGGFVFIRSNFGLELSLSNHPGVYVLHVDNLWIGFPNNYYHQHHPWASLKDAEEVRDWGEIKYNRYCLHQAVQWIRANPRGFVNLTVKRTLYFWFTPLNHQPVKTFALIVWTLIAAWGLRLALQHHHEFGLQLLAIWIGFPLVYYIIQTDTRYRYPVDWTFTLLAVYVLAKPLWASPACAPEAVGFAHEA